MTITAEQVKQLREMNGAGMMYRNLRPKFVETFLNSLVNWSFAEANFG